MSTVNKEDEKKFLLRWDNFKCSMVSNFLNLYVTKELVDVTLASRDGQFQAHKLVLAACSPYFKDIFLQNPCQHPVIILRDVSSEQLSRMLTFIYDGEVCLPQSCFQDFVKLAAVFKIKGLEDAASKSVSNKNLANTNDYHVNIHNNSGSLNKETNFLNPLINEQTGRFRSTEGENASKRARVCSPANTPPVQRSASPAQASSPPPQDEDELHDPLDLKTDLQNMLEIKIEPGEGYVPSSSASITPTDSERNSWYKPSTANHQPEPFQSDLSDGEPNELHIAHPPCSSKSDSASQRNTQPIVAPSTSDNLFLLPNSLLNNPNSMSTYDQMNVKLVKSYVKFRPQFPSDCENMPFPCPFCDKAYTSWGFRRRHIKAYHASKPELTCKWCTAVLPTPDEWLSHVQKMHNLSCIDAKSGVMILDEAHTVLQSAMPTRIASMMDNPGNRSSVSTTSSAAGKNTSTTTKNNNKNVTTTTSPSGVKTGGALTCASSESIVTRSKRDSSSSTKKAGDHSHR